MGKFVYKNKECMDKMHEFYDKALNSLNMNYCHMASFLCKKYNRK